MRAKMEDQGTRLDHLTDLRSLWQIGLDILNRRNASSYLTEPEKKDIIKLENAIELLNAHISKDYIEDHEFQYRQVINTLPRHGEEIKG